MLIFGARHKVARGQSTRLLIFGARHKVARGQRHKVASFSRSGTRLLEVITLSGIPLFLTSGWPGGVALAIAAHWCRCSFSSAVRIQNQEPIRSRQKTLFPLLSGSRMDGMSNLVMATFSGTLFEFLGACLCLPSLAQRRHHARNCFVWLVELLRGWRCTTRCLVSIHR